MAFPDYIFADTANDQLNESQLHSEIVAAGPYSSNFEAVDANRNLQTFSTIFDAPPSAPDQATVDAVVAAHVAGVISDMRLTSSVVERGVPLGAGFAMLGSLTMDPTNYIKDLATAIIRVKGTLQANGDGANLRLVESGPDVVVGVFAVSNSAGVNATFSFDTTVQLRAGLREYRLEGDLGAAVAASVQGVIIQLINQVQP